MGFLEGTLKKWMKTTGSILAGEQKIISLAKFFSHWFQGLNLVADLRGESLKFVSSEFSNTYIFFKQVEVEYRKVTWRDVEMID